MFVGTLLFCTDTDNTSLVLTTIFCLELKEIRSVVKVSRFGHLGFLDMSCLIKLAHNSGHRKFLAIDKCVIWNSVWNSHVALWLRAHTEKSAAVHAKSGSSLTCRGTFYKLLHSSQESKHRQQCPGIELGELGRPRLELKLSLPFLSNAGWGREGFEMPRLRWLFCASSGKRQV